MRHNIRKCRPGARVDCCPCPPNKKCSTSPASPSSPAQPYTHRVNLWRFIVAGIQLLLLLLLLLLHTNFIFYTNREEFSYFVIDFCLLTLSLAIFELLAFRAKCFLFCLFCFCFFLFFTGIENNFLMVVQRVAEFAFNDNLCKSPCQPSIAYWISCRKGVSIEAGAWHWTIDKTKLWPIGGRFVNYASTASNPHLAGRQREV